MWQLPISVNSVALCISLNLFSVNIHIHQKPSSAIFREGIRLGLVIGLGSVFAKINENFHGK